MKTRIVKLMGYGDFDQPYVHCTFIAPDDMEDFYIQGIMNEVSKTFKSTREPDDAINLLKSCGFKPCKEYSCTIGGDL